MAPSPVVGLEWPDGERLRAATYMGGWKQTEPKQRIGGGGSIINLIIMLALSLSMHRAAHRTNTP